MLEPINTFIYSLKICDHVAEIIPYRLGGLGYEIGPVCVCVFVRLCVC